MFRLLRCITASPAVAASVAVAAAQTPTSLRPAAVCRRGVHLAPSVLAASAPPPPPQQQQQPTSAAVPASTATSTTTIAAGPYRRVGNVFIVTCIDHPFKFSWEVNRMLRELRLEFMGQTTVVPDIPPVRKRIWRVRHVVRVDQLDLDEAKALIGIPEHISFRDLAGQIPPTFGRGGSVANPHMRSKMNFMRLRRMRLRDVMHRDQLEKRLLEERHHALQQQQQQQQSTNDARLANSVDRGADVSQRYRVGRVVGVVPKPGPKAAEASHGKSASAACAGLAAAAADEGQRWLLAVYVGECVEPFAVSAIAEDVFTEAEHRIFVQSALSTNREDGSRRASVLPSQQPALLSAETAATVQQNIKDIRVALQLTQAADKTGAVAVAEAATAQLMQRASGLKRPHAASDDDGDINSHKRRTEAASTGEDGDGIGTYFGNGASSQAVRISRLTEDLVARGTQLQQLRQLLQQKDQEVKAALQQQQQQEARHRGEVDAWRAKVEEQSRTRERIVKESRESLEQRDRLLEEANTKLRRLAGMATKYKQVVDAVAALLKRGGGGEASDGTVMTPEDILIALQAKKCL